MSKILLINNGYPSLTNPHRATFIESIYNDLLKAGFIVDKLVLDTNFTNKQEYFLKYIKYYKELFFINLNDYDIIYIHNLPHSIIPLIFKLNKHKNIVVHWHGTDIFHLNSFTKLLNNFSYKFNKYIRLHITPSEYFAKVIIDKLQLRPNKVLVSPSGGVNTEIFYPKENTIDNNTCILGFASGLVTEKGIDTIIELIKNTNDIEKETNKKIILRCINYGVEKNKYLSILKQFSNVEIVAPTSKEKMAYFYRSINILLLPSRLSESLALVGLEAMSCNVPVVGTNDFAIKDYVVSGVSGEKFSKGNVSSFIQTVIKTINNLELYTPREIVLTKYSEDYVVEQYRKEFGKLIEKYPE